MIENSKDSGKPRYICIVENDPARIERMTAALATLKLAYTPVYFHEARAAIEWLKENISDVVFISLDYDLYRPGETMSWPGDGMEVVEWLETSASTAGHHPMVIIHSARCKTAHMMVKKLIKCGYRTGRVIPHENWRWIEEEWIRLIITLVNNPLCEAFDEIEKRWPGLLKSLGDE